MRVRALLCDERIPFETVYHAPAYTATRRARYLRLPGRQVAKGVLLAGPDGYLLAVLPATDQVDTERLGRTLGGPVRLATQQEVAGVFRDCECGVVPPFGTLYGVPTLLEDTVPPDAWIVCEGNLRAEDVRLRCRDFERLERPRRLPLARRTRPSGAGPQQLL
jgi:Ala-tRNA(Pro) deacylase